MKRTFLFSILAIIPAALMPLAATCQLSKAPRSQSTDETPRTFKYDAFVGYGYSSLNQVNESRYGLSGVTASVTRDWGKYFGLTAEGDYYRYPFSTPEIANSTIVPSVDSVLLGPVVHANIYGKFDGFIHGLLGGEHTAGTSQTPHISFAGGFGGGVDYALTPRFSIRASGDIIGASFSLVGNSAQLGNSPHKTWDSRASFGAVYHF